LSPQIQQKKLDIKFIINSKDKTVFANKRMIEEMIYNLLENSIKYINWGRNPDTY
jgi:signal transduction histidine kinase